MHWYLPWDQRRDCCSNVAAAEPSVFVHDGRAPGITVHAGACGQSSSALWPGQCILVTEYVLNLCYWEHNQNRRMYCYRKVSARTGVGSKIWGNFNLYHVWIIFQLLLYGITSTVIRCILPNSTADYYLPLRRTIDSGGLNPWCRQDST